MESEAIEYLYIPRTPPNASRTRISPAEYEMWESSRYNELESPVTMTHGLRASVFTDCTQPIS